MRWLLAALAWTGVAWATGFAAPPPPSTPVVAKLAPYTIAPDLANVANRDQLPTLTAEQRARLRAVGLVARPTVEEQPFYLYDHSKLLGLPQFVTSDSVLHTWLVTSGYLLRYIERERLAPAVSQLNARLLALCTDELRHDCTPELRRALTLTAAYCAVPLVLLDRRPRLLPELQPVVRAEVERVRAHALTAPGLFGRAVDYTRFDPPDRYAASPALARWFQALTWHAEVEFEPTTPAGLLPLVALLELRGADEGAATLWRRLTAASAFLGARRGTFDRDELSAALTAVAGRGPLSRWDTATLARLAATPAWQAAVPAGLLARRDLPETRWPAGGGLGLLASLGSARAVELLTRAGETAPTAGAWPAGYWQQSVPAAQLWATLPLLTPAPAGYPSCMRTDAWLDKSLVCALGAWTEARHARLPLGRRTGEGFATPRGEPRAGWVEPQPECYERLTWLLGALRGGLLDLQLIAPDDEIAAPLDNFAELLASLTTISRKELAGVPLSLGELETIRGYGTTLESLMLEAAALGADGRMDHWRTLPTRAERHQALVADLERRGDPLVQELLGPPTELWVVVPFKQRLVVCRGAGYSWYERVGPAAQRWTTASWLAALSATPPPALPNWTQSFLLGPGLSTPLGAGLAD